MVRSSIQLQRLSPRWVIPPVSGVLSAAIVAKLWSNSWFTGLTNMLRSTSHMKEKWLRSQLSKALCQRRKNHHPVGSFDSIRQSWIWPVLASNHWDISKWWRSPPIAPSFKNATLIWSATYCGKLLRIWQMSDGAGGGGIVRSDRRIDTV
jgi:hypothetical protein